MKAYLDIIDPIHDFIRLGAPEQRIVDSATFQRLRRIRQLSGAHLTYPGAQHTRFEHSLGVMYLAGRAARHLAERGVLDPDRIGEIRLAGLLHDIGHGPFSHTFEEIMLERSGISHERIGRDIIEKTEIADMISESGHDKGSVARLAFGGHRIQYMNELVSGALSADIMDYLLRDGYFTGAEHAKLDHKRIIQSLDVYQDALALERSALHSFESMMHSRYQMFKAVYSHRAVRAAEVMLLESIRLADDELGLGSPGMSDYLQLDDETLLSRILAAAATTSRMRRAQRFVRDYQNRRLFKCAYERFVTSRSRLDRSRTDSMRAEIAGRSGVDEDLIFVDNHVAPSVPLTPSKEECRFITLVSYRDNTRTGSRVPISDIPLVSAMSGFMNILRVYTHGERKKVEIAAQSTLAGLER